MYAFILLDDRDRTGRARCVEYISLVSLLMVTTCGVVYGAVVCAMWCGCSRCEFCESTAMMGYPCYMSLDMAENQDIQCVKEYMLAFGTIGCVCFFFGFNVKIYYERWCVVPLCDEF